MTGILQKTEVVYETFCSGCINNRSNCKGCNFGSHANYDENNEEIYETDENYMKGL